MRSLILAALVLASCASQPLPPTDASTTYTTKSLNTSVDCADFHRGANASWSPLRDVTIVTPNGQVRVDQSMSFTPGVYFMGVDLASALNRQCP